MEQKYVWSALKLKAFIMMSWQYNGNAFPLTRPYATGIGSGDYTTPVEWYKQIVLQIDH